MAAILTLSMAASLFSAQRPLPAVAFSRRLLSSLSKSLGFNFDY
jgi:hypothetical protein